MMRAWLGERDELPDDPLVAMVPVSGAHRGADGRVRQSDLGDVHPDPDRRARRSPADRAHPRGAAGGQGASRGHPRVADAGRQPVRAAGGDEQRVAPHPRCARPLADAGAQPRDLQRAGTARAALLRGRRDGGLLPRCRRSSTASGSTSPCSATAITWTWGSSATAISSRTPGRCSTVCASRWRSSTALLSSEAAAAAPAPELVSP